MDEFRYWKPGVLPVVISPHVPEGRVHVLAGGTLLVPPDPTPVQIIFRDCRREIVRDCPTIAPREWSQLERLRPLADLIAALSAAMGVVA